MRIVMMGTGGFAVPTFRWLLESSHEVPTLVTRPPRPARGRAKVPVNPMRQVAEQQGLPVLMPPSINDAAVIDDLARLDVDLYIVCDYGQILSSDALGSSRLGGINLHASLLPRYRGAAPINWALYHGESETGLSVIHMSPKLDAGPCLVQTRTPIDRCVDAIQMEEQLADLGVQAVRESIDLLEQWDGTSPIGEPQDPTRVSKAPRLKKSDGQVDWSRTAGQIFDQVRALKPWPGTFTVWQRPGKPMRLVLDEVQVTEDVGTSNSPGTVVTRDATKAVIACGQGALDLRVVQPEGKKRMPIDAFLHGYPLAEGDQLG